MGPQNQGQDTLLGTFWFRFVQSARKEVKVAQILQTRNPNESFLVMVADFTTIYYLKEKSFWNQVSTKHSPFSPFWTEPMGHL